MRQFLKLTMMFLLVIATAIAIFFTGWQIWQKYQYQKRQKENLAQKNIDQIIANQIKNDSFGGQTPKKTLVMLINAVEKNNLESASRYFIVQSQSENLKILKNNQANEKTAGLLKIWKQLLKNKDLANFSNEEFFNDGDLDYADKQNIYNNKEFILVDNLESNNPLMAIFRLYPRGIWKIRAISMN